jgi:hypothetical protein
MAGIRAGVGVSLQTGVGVGADLGAVRGDWCGNDVGVVPYDDPLLYDPLLSGGLTDDEQIPAVAQAGDALQAVLLTEAMLDARGVGYPPRRDLPRGQVLQMRLDRALERGMITPREHQAGSAALQLATTDARIGGSPLSSSAGGARGRMMQAEAARRAQLAALVPSTSGVSTIGGCFGPDVVSNGVYGPVYDPYAQAYGPYDLGVDPYALPPGYCGPAYDPYAQLYGVPVTRTVTETDTHAVGKRVSFGPFSIGVGASVTTGVSVSRTTLR